VADWRALLTQQTQDGRQLLRELLARPLKFTPQDRQYRFEGEVPIGRLLSGLSALPHLWRPRAVCNLRDTDFRSISSPRECTRGRHSP
jgi:hypothetical protein